MFSTKSIRSAFTFAMSFGAAKGTAFVAALTMPRLVDATTYGAIEVALTIGMMAAAILSSGAPSAAVRLQLVENDDRARHVLVGNVLWLATAGVLTASLAAATDAAPQYVCGMALIGLFGFQISAAAYTRLQGYIHLSGWFDNITMIVIVVLLGGLSLAGGGAELQHFIWLLLVLGGAIGLVALIGFVRTPLHGIVPFLSTVLTTGAPMMIYGVSNLLIFGTARIAIAKALTLTDAGIFSLCMRITLVLVFASQLLQTGLFRSVYQLDTEKIGRFFALWIVALSGIALVITAAGHFLAPLLVAGTPVPPEVFAALFPAVAVQTTFWVLNSNLEMFITRELLARQAAVACVVIAAIGLVVGIGLWKMQVLTLAMIINLYSVGMFVLLVTQMRLLSRRGVRFGKSYRLLPLALAPLVISLMPA